MVEEIESGSIVPCFQLHPFIELSNTRRLSDDKSMSEIMFQAKKTLEAELSKLVVLSDDDNVKLLQQKIAALNTLLSSLILDGLCVEENIADDTFKNCANISGKLARLKHEQKKWLQSQTQPRKEEKEAKETKENNDVAPDLEISLTQLGEEIFIDLNNFELTQEYNLFKARCYYEIARCLFSVDTKDMRLQISQATLKLGNDSLKKALEFSQSFTIEDMPFRNLMVALKVTVSPYLPASNGYDKLESTLETLIPYAEELKLREKDPITFSQLDDLLSVHAEGTFEFSNETQSKSISGAISGALVRSNRVIDALKENLEKEKKEKMEAQAREQLLQEKVANLKKQLLEVQQQNNIRENSSELPAVGEQPVPTFLPMLKMGKKTARRSCFRRRGAGKYPAGCETKENSRWHRLKLSYFSKGSRFEATMAG